MQNLKVYDKSKITEIIAEGLTEEMQEFVNDLCENMKSLPEDMQEK